MDEYDLLIIPGGVKSLEKLRQEQQVLDFISDWNDRDKTIACICHGGQMLISAKITEGRDVSGYYSIKDDLINSGGNFRPPLKVKDVFDNCSITGISTDASTPPRKKLNNGKIIKRPIDIDKTGV